MMQRDEIHVRNRPVRLVVVSADAKRIGDTRNAVTVLLTPVGVGGHSYTELQMSGRTAAQWTGSYDFASSSSAPGHEVVPRPQSGHAAAATLHCTPHLSLMLLLPPLSRLPSPWLRPPALLRRGSIGSAAPAAASPRLPRLPVLGASLLELARTSSGMSAVTHGHQMSAQVTIMHGTCINLRCQVSRRAETCVGARLAGLRPWQAAATSER